MRVLASIAVGVALLSSIDQGLAQEDADLSWLPFDGDNFDNRKFISDDIVLLWQLGVDGNENRARFGFASRSEGYLAVGFSETGAMTGSQIALGRQTDDGFEFTARKAGGFFTPEVQEGSDITFVEGAQGDGVTGFVFDKDIHVDCYDGLNDIRLDGQLFIWAWSTSNDFVRHDSDKRGSTMVTLQGEPFFFEGLSHDFGNDERWDIIMQDIPIPTEETNYCYSLHKVPDGATRYYITGDTPNVDNELVHHLVVYGCFGGSPFTEEEAQRLQDGAICEYAMGRCNSFIAEWAPGNRGRAFQANMGLPMGSEVELEYLLLEVHYDNPRGLEGETDSSGLTLYYSEEDKEIEIGLFATGDFQPEDSLWAIPPGDPFHLYEINCTPECMEKGLDEDITIIAAGYHMHGTGTQMELGIIRDGEEVEKFHTMKYYDFNYQPFFPMKVTMKPGDRLITRCWYDTSDKREEVRAGLGSDEEMCMMFMAYFPRKDLTLCSNFTIPSEEEGAEMTRDAYCHIIGLTVDERFLGLAEEELAPPFEPLERNETCPADGPAEERDSADQPQSGSACEVLEPTLFSLLMIAFIYDHVLY